MARTADYITYIKSVNWRKTSSNVIASTGNRCALYPWKRATHAHHLHYKNLQNEWAIRDCVPLSPEAHELIHQDKLWNLNGNSKTPSPLRPIVSNYLRVATVCLILLKPLLMLLNLGKIKK